MKPTLIHQFLLGLFSTLLTTRIYVMCIQPFTTW